ncbi:ABC transporter ATP-binding protein [Eubacterium uniforme]|uniref:ABC-2 type transport system ATP-binding protein n=1 Tax=Eubacterium uniforme TaxID=39495 RepID=A0A1T4VUP1_9FIRM|nr:ABC transporter ATP-binding protein [Eubacterium uniforme]SKA68639.1 ABC-2 type transport system ATP-binding protein [Eubacterium uniforme]
MKEVALKTKGLTKEYGKFKALDNVDMTVFRGDIYGLIGRNGAGKTTIMKTITGLTNPTSGLYEVFGQGKENSQKTKRRVGCLIENPAFFGNLTGWQNLKYYCKLKGIVSDDKIFESLRLVDLEEAKDKKFKTYSLGMKQRLGIALAIMDDPDFIILDEPINGLDPIGISKLRDTFKMLNKERNLTIMISSHILSELYAVANRFMFIDHGSVIKEITKEELDDECSRCLVVKVDDVKKSVGILENKLGISKYKVVDNDLIRIYEEDINAAVINRELVINNVAVSSVGESGVSLEEYFKGLVKEVSND